MDRLTHFKGASRNLTTKSHCLIYLEKYQVIEGWSKNNHKENIGQRSCHQENKVDEWQEVDSNTARPLRPNPRSEGCVQECQRAENSHCYLKIPQLLCLKHGILHSKGHLKQKQIHNILYAAITMFVKGKGMLWMECSWSKQWESQCVNDQSSDFPILRCDVLSWMIGLRGKTSTIQKLFTSAVSV